LQAIHLRCHNQKTRSSHARGKQML
jgi:hypothetical protein